MTTVLTARQLTRHYSVSQGLFKPSATVQAPVSYTHLTLPTTPYV